MPFLAVLKTITCIYTFVHMFIPAQKHVQKLVDILQTISLRVTRLEAAGEQAFDEDDSDQDDDLSQAGTPRARI